jgi:putative membrane protein
VITRPTVLVLLVAAANVLSVGFVRLSRRRRVPLAPRRLALALGGLMAIGIALVSPLDALAHEYFVAHMVQHMLLSIAAAPAMVLADVFPLVLWALPRAARRIVGAAFTRAGAGRWLLAWTTTPAVAWLLSVAVLWLWHLPALYDRALERALLHDLEHLAFFLSALIFWWPVMDPAPRVRPALPLRLRVVYVILAGFQSGALGLALTLSPTVLYQTYAREGFDALTDQARGGIVMWAGSGLVDMAAVLVLVWRVLLATERPLALARPRPARESHLGSH